MKLKDLLLEVSLNEGKSDYKFLMKNKMKLTPEERKEAMDRGCVWHFNGGGPSCAIWKSKKKDGKVVYGCNTHRCMQVKKTLKGAINAFKFVKTTA